MIRVSDLHFSYGSFPVLRGVSVDVRAGEVCGLFGPNGCGKTTLFYCCLGLLRARARTLSVAGREVSPLPPAERARLMAFVPQEHKPPFPLTVTDVVMLGRTPHLGILGRTSDADGEIVAQAIRRVGLDALADRPYDRLSGGQRQLVLIARAVAQQTPVILLDEPASGLDFRNQVLIWCLLRDLAATGTTILCCSHDPNHMAWFSDRVIVMNAGEVVASGPPAEALSASVLQGLYPDACAVTRVNGTSVVLPSTVVSRDRRGDR